MGYPIYHSAYTAAQIEAAIGKGPRVNASGYWEVWNVGTGAYESTGVGAGVTPPTVVTQVSQMTNHGYIYIYNGTETGYTAGYWYYWDGSAWTAGGAYQVAATDTTLTVAGAAADAKATGDKLGELKSALENKMDKGATYTVIPQTLTKNAYINTSGTEVQHNNDCYVTADVSELSGTLIIWSFVPSSLYEYIFFDVNDNILSYGTHTGSQGRHVVVAEIPNGATKIIANGTLSSTIGIPAISSVSLESQLTTTNSGIYSSLAVPTEFTDIVYNWNNGTVFQYTNGAYVQSETARSIVMNVKEGEYYRITGKSYYSYNIIGLLYAGVGVTWIPNASNDKYFDIVIKIPHGVVYMIVQGKQSETTTIKKASAFANGRIFYGKKIAIIGDSIIERSTQVPMKWYDNISILTGLEVVNLGVSGTGYKNGQSNNKAYYQRISSIPADVDAVVIFGSGNDNTFTAGTTTDNTTDTVLGCVNKTINDIISLYPLKKIGVITAYPWRSWKPATDNNMQTIANGIVQICRDNSIPCLDLYHQSNLRPWIDANNNNLFLSADGTHVNEEGHKILTPMMLEFLKTLLLSY